MIGLHGDGGDGERQQINSENQSQCPTTNKRPVNLTGRLLVQFSPASDEQTGMKEQEAVLHDFSFGDDHIVFGYILVETFVASFHAFDLVDHVKTIDHFAKYGVAKTLYVG